jgi:hypothetical protein
MRLEREAAAAGGRVHALIGNHDAGVIYGDLRGTLPEEYGDFRQPDSQEKLEKAFEEELAARKRQGHPPPDAGGLEYLRKSWFESHSPGFVEHREAFSPAGYYGSWIRRHNSVIRINDSLFVHAGISPKYVKHTRQQLNAAIRRELADPSRLLPGVATDIQGPLWYRGLAEEETGAADSHVQAVLRFHGVQRIVIGHSVTRTAILPRYGGRVVNIDLGLSRFYGRPPACLVLEQAAQYVLHRNTRIPLPAAGRNDVAGYLEAVEAADVQPSPVGNLLKRMRAEQ